jgi:hypothetical protein
MPYIAMHAAPAAIERVKAANFQGLGEDVLADTATVASSFANAAPGIITAVQGKPANVRIVPPPTPPKFWYGDWKVWAAVGVGVLLLGGGAFALTRKK